MGNHSAWDNPLAAQHPDWYTHTPEGDFQPTPWYDWDDVIDFDYDKPEMRRYMTGALTYWVKDFGIDGYRCDVGGFIPVDFWDNARAELDAIKPVFMLAEWESRDMQKKAFDMTYSWTLFEKMYGIVNEHKPLAGLVEYLAHDVGAFPRGGYRMLFVDNHDMNSWNGNQVKNFGPALMASIVLTGTANGMPLCYSGQEAGLARSLRFFDKDTIHWKPTPEGDLYTQDLQAQAREPGSYGTAYGAVRWCAFSAIRWIRSSPSRARWGITRSFPSSTTVTSRPRLR